MKIALAVPSLVPGAGIPNVVVAWANRFAAWGHQAAIITLHSTRRDIGPGVEVYVPPLLSRGVRLWGRSGALRRLLSYPLLRWLRQRRFDIINVHYTPMDVLLGELRKQVGSRFVYTYYGVSEPELFSGEARKRRLAEDAEMRNWLPRCDRALIISRFLQEQVSRLYPRLGSVVITPGIDLDQFQPPASLATPETPTLLYVGRISPHKGVHHLLSAFQTIRQSVPQARLHVVGRHDEDDYWRSLQPQLDESPGVNYLGECSQAELLTQYQGASLFACASLWEGFGLPFLEAEACGVPCVGFAAASIPEVVLDGETGLLVVPGDVQALADAVVRLLRDNFLRQSMGRQARKHAERYSWEVIVRNVLKEFEGLLMPGGTR